MKALGTFVACAGNTAAMCKAWRLQLGRQRRTASVLPSTTASRGQGRGRGLVPGRGHQQLLCSTAPLTQPLCAAWPSAAAPAVLCMAVVRLRGEWWADSSGRTVQLRHLIIRLAVSRTQRRSTVIDLPFLMKSAKGVHATTWGMRVRHACSPKSSAGCRGAAWCGSHRTCISI